MPEVSKNSIPDIETRIRELQKCQEDPVYYLNTYGYVYNDVEHVLSPMKCFKYQEKCVKRYEKRQKNIVLKSRQTGLSAVTAGYAAARAMFHPGEKVLIIANNALSAERFLSTIREFIKHTPKWLQPNAILKDNTRAIEFSNGSTIQARASNPEAGRGEAITLLIIDEAAFIKDIEPIWKAAAMTISKTNGKCIIISTPKGTGGLYHRLWMGAVYKEQDSDGTMYNNGFFPIRVHWTENPMCAIGLEKRKNEKGEEVWWSPWYEEQKRVFNYDPVSIAQELDLSFEGSKHLAIDAELVRKYENLVGDGKPECYIKYNMLYKGENVAGEFTKEETKFLVWKKPEKGGSYIVAADVSRGGEKGDYSTIQVLDAITLEQCAEYRDKIEPYLFPYIIDWVGKQYNTAYVVPEANSFGLGVAYELRNRLNYKRLHYSKSVDDMHVRSSVDYIVKKNTDIPGFQTTKANRPLMIMAISEYMREGSVIIHSRRLLAEMQTFIMNGDKPEAEKGYHDDLVMAFAIALYIRTTEYKNLMSSEKSTLDLLNAISFGTTGFYRDRTQEKIFIKSKESTKDVSDVPPEAGGIFLNLGDMNVGGHKDEFGNIIGGNNNNNESDPDDLSWLYDKI